MGDQISTLSLQELQTVRTDLIAKLKRVNDRIKLLMEEDTQQLSDETTIPKKEKKVVKKVAKKPSGQTSETVTASNPSVARATGSDEQEDSEGLLKKVTMDDMRFILNKNKIVWSSSMKRADLSQLIRSNALIRKALKYHNDRVNSKTAAGSASTADSD